MEANTTVVVRVPIEMKFRLERMVDGNIWKNTSHIVRLALQNFLKKYGGDDHVIED